jgi:uncharacterized protein YdhG (YjbR/CyaY superfamily)
MKTYKTISEYIKNQPKEVQERLVIINKLIKKISPKSMEGISYGMPTYKVDGKVLVYFAGFKNHVSLFPFPATLKVFESLTKEYTTSKGTIQFQNDAKLPVGLITKLVKYRAGEVTKKVCSRGHVFYGKGPCPVCWPGRLKVSPR